MKEYLETWGLTLFLLLVLLVVIADTMHGTTCWIPEGCTTPVVVRATEDMLIVIRGEDVVAASLDGYVCGGTLVDPHCHRAIPAQDAMEGSK